jgi:hypothetical protein
MSFLRNVSAEPPHPHFFLCSRSIPLPLSLSYPPPQCCHSSCHFHPEEEGGASDSAGVSRWGRGGKYACEGDGSVCVFLIVCVEGVGILWSKMAANGNQGKASSFSLQA